MKNLLKVREAVDANRAAGGKPRYIYCSPTLEPVLYQEMGDHLKLLSSERNVSGIQLFFGCELRSSGLLKEDTVIVLGGPIDTIS